MSFDTLSFWIYLIPLLIVYWLVPRRWQNFILLFSSYAFYASWDWKFLLLLIISTGTDFFTGHLAKADHRQSVRRLGVILSLVVNLGLLLTFKYYNFFIDEFKEFIPFQFLTSNFIIEMALPIGISFYTFQTISYTIDIYRKRLSPAKSLLDFSVFVAFFPQLVAGPIERAHRLLPQIQSPRIFKWQDITAGSLICLQGLFKKIYVANALYFPIEAVFQNKAPVPAPMMLAAAVLITFQVYTDFSGYSDIARGLSKMLGINITINFKPFYLSLNPSKFWQRWHISLTLWIRDYLILSLKKAKQSPLMTDLHIFIVLIAVGIWHAPTWNWLLFGTFNGLMIVLYRQISRYSRKRRIKYPAPVKAACGAAVLLFMCIVNGLLHRSNTMDLVEHSFRSIMGDWTSWRGAYDLLRYAALFILPLSFFEALQEYYKDYDLAVHLSFFFKVIFVVVTLAGIIIFSRNTDAGFIYYEF